MKKESETECTSKLVPRLQALFQFTLQTRTTLSSGLPLGWFVHWCRRPPAHSFRRCETAPPPQAQPSNTAAGRWRSHRIRKADRRREPKTGGKACFHIRFRPSSSLACRTSNKPINSQKPAFGMGLGRGFGLPKPPSQRLPP